MESVPGVYRGWLGQLLEGPIEGERRSTCSSCALCEDPVGVTFRPDVKCCGYLPKLPNYLAGGALREGGPGAESIRRRMAERVAVTPLGLGCPPLYSARWQEVERTTGFGSDPDLICPHFDQGACTIWAHREAVCTTWFCRLDRGAVGQAFWLELRAFLQVLESVLSRWALKELGVGATWSSWEGEREDLYIATAERVEALSWDEVRRIGGFALRTRRRSLRAAHAARVHPAPVRHPLTVTAFRSEQQGEAFRLSGWSDYDVLDVPAAVLESLQQPEKLAPDLVRQLVDHGILEEPHG